MPFTVALRTQMIETRQTLAVGLAEELLEEILLKPFEEPDDGDEAAEPVENFGPELGESDRSQYTAIDDFHGYEEAAGTIRDLAGDVVNDPAAAGLSRHVTVEYVDVAGQPAEEGPCFLRVIVEVRYLGEAVVTLTRLVHWLN
jgi:hypothetical protein